MNGLNLQDQMLLNSSVGQDIMGVVNPQVSEITNEAFDETLEQGATAARESEIIRELLKEYRYED